MHIKILPGFFLLIIISTATNAQIKKGAVLLGGQFSFNSQKNESSFSGTSKNNGFTISPAVGMALKENTIVGVDLNFSHSKNQVSPTGDSKSNGYGAGFFVRRYKVLGGGFYLFGQARIGGMYSKQSFSDALTPANNSSADNFTVQLGFYPGVSYALSKKLQVEAGFSDLALFRYSHSQQSGANNSGTYKSNGFLFSSSLSSFAGPTIGFQLLFN